MLEPLIGELQEQARLSNACARGIGGGIGDFGQHGGEGILRKTRELVGQGAPGGEGGGGTSRVGFGTRTRVADDYVLEQIPAKRARGERVGVFSASEEGCDEGPGC